MRERLGSYDAADAADAVVLGVSTDPVERVAAEHDGLVLGALAL